MGCHCSERHDMGISSVDAWKTVALDNWKTVPKLLVVHLLWLGFVA